MAKAQEKISFQMNKVPVSSITFDVDLHFTRLFKIRLWLGLSLIHLLATVWDCDVEVVYADDPSRIKEVKK